MLLGFTTRFCGGGGGSMVVLDNMHQERPIVGFRTFDARYGKYINC